MAPLVAALYSSRLKNHHPNVHHTNGISEPPSHTPSRTPTPPILRGMSVRFWALGRNVYKRSRTVEPAGVALQRGRNALLRSCQSVSSFFVMYSTTCPPPHTHSPLPFPVFWVADSTELGAPQGLPWDRRAVSIQRVRISFPRLVARWSWFKYQ